MSNKFTPGPWHLAKDQTYEPGALCVIGTRSQPGNVGACVCRVATAANMTVEDVHNAALIAAAPDLLEALKLLTPSLPPVDAMCHGGITTQEKCANCQRIIAAYAAIAKAEGGGE